MLCTHSGVIWSPEKQMEHLCENAPHLWNQTWVGRSWVKVWWLCLVPWDLAKKNIGTTTWSHDPADDQPPAANDNRTWCNLCQVAGEGEDLGILTPGIASWFQGIDTHVFSNGTNGMRLFICSLLVRKPRHEWGRSAATGSGENQDKSIPAHSLTWCNSSIWNQAV